VLTALEFERLVSSTGPTQGRLLIDGKEPRRVLFIQCVGQETDGGERILLQGLLHVTAKQASLVKEKIPTRPSRFATSTSGPSEGYEEFYEEVQKKGVIYRKGVPSEIYQKSGS